MRPIGQAGTRSPLACAALLAAAALEGCAHAAAPAREAAAGTGGTPEGQVRFTGRVTLDAFDPDAIRFGWQGSGLVATVRGTRIAAWLSSDDGREIFFDVVVDGMDLPRVSVASRAGQEVTLAEGLADAPHAVELYRDTESHQGVSRFLGFTAGVVGEAPPSTGRLIEIVGDSIPAGWGNLGRETHSPRGDTGGCGWTAANSSWAQSFGAIAGHALGAEVSTIAMSGWGMYEGNDDDRTHAIGMVYERSYGAYVPGTWTFPRAPQAVVVHLGGNDLGPRDRPTFDRQLFVRAGLDLIARIRAHAPEAWILLAMAVRQEDDDPERAVLGATQQAVVDEARRGGDGRIERIELPMRAPGPDGEIVTGCLWHPDVADHARMAEALRERLHALLGW